VIGDLRCPMSYANDGTVGVYEGSDAQVNGTLVEHVWMGLQYPHSLVVVAKVDIPGTPENPVTLLLCYGEMYWKGRHMEEKLKVNEQVKERADKTAEMRRVRTSAQRTRTRTRRLCTPREGK